jgi:ankyrin repeat protein
MTKSWIHKEDALGETPLVRAMRCGNRTLIEFMLGQEYQEDVDGPVETPEDSLQSAAYWGAAQAVHALLENGVSVTDRDACGETALHKAVRNGHRETIETLLEHGAQVNVPDDRGLTPLHWAALSGNPEVAEMLLDQGADARACAVFLGDLSPRSIAGLMGYDQLAEVLDAHGVAAV